MHTGDVGNACGLARQSPAPRPRVTRPRHIADRKQQLDGAIAAAQLARTKADAQAVQLAHQAENTYRLGLKFAPAALVEREAEVSRREREIADRARLFQENQARATSELAAKPMLDEAVHDNELPLAIRQRAQSVLQHYPRTADLEELLTRDGVTLPQTWASALIEARAFLVDLRRRPGSTEMMMWSVTVTLRHFPDECDIGYLSRARDLGEWFVPEARRDS